MGIATDATGKVWKNSSGKIIKSKSMSQTVIQDGLDFWGAADPNYLTIVNGLVSEAYDIRGNGNKMIQNTVANRFQYTPYALRANGGMQYLTKSVTGFKTLFFVYNPLGSSSRIRMFVDYNDYFGCEGPNLVCRISGSTTGVFYKNSTKYTGSTTFISGKQVSHTLSPYSRGTVNLVVGCSDTAYNSELYEWGWYNRLLSEIEVIYNINALNAKYSIY